MSEMALVLPAACLLLALAAFIGLLTYLSKKKGRKHRSAIEALTTGVEVDASKGTTFVQTEDGHVVRRSTRERKPSLTNGEFVKPTPRTPAPKTKEDKPATTPKAAKTPTVAVAAATPRTRRSSSGAAAVAAAAAEAVKEEPTPSGRRRTPRV